MRFVVCYIVIVRFVGKWTQSPGGRTWYEVCGFQQFQSAARPQCTDPVDCSEDGLYYNCRRWRRRCCFLGDKNNFTM